MVLGAPGRRGDINTPAWSMLWSHRAYASEPDYHIILIEHGSHWAPVTIIDTIGLLGSD